MPTKPWLTARVVVAATAKVPVAIVLPSESMVKTAVLVAPEESVTYNFLAPAESPKARIMFSVVVAVMSPVILNVVVAAVTVRVLVAVMLSVLIVMVPPKVPVAA